MNNKSYTKKALTLSLLFLLTWSVLGAGTTVAWFTDTTSKKTNTFYIGDLDMKVTYIDENGNYKELSDDSNVFDDYALYEPGYVQVVYLKIENIGDIEFDYTAAVTVNDYTPGVNKYGQSFNLVPYLTYGVLIEDDIDVLKGLIDTREKALGYVTEPLSTYTSDVDTLDVNEDAYMALIVSMPTSVGNEANHNGNVPTVKLGLSFKASQSGTLN